MVDWQAQGKTIHHKCGYPLWVRVAHQFEGVRDGSVVSVVGRGDVVVEYRDLSQGDGLMVWMCPECYGALSPVVGLEWAVGWAERTARMCCR